VATYTLWEQTFTRKKKLKPCSLPVARVCVCVCVYIYIYIGGIDTCSCHHLFSKHQYYTHDKFVGEMFLVCESDS
jgi:hypothetical protein